MVGLCDRACSDRDFRLSRDSCSRASVDDEPQMGRSFRRSASVELGRRWFESLAANAVLLGSLFAVSTLICNWHVGSFVRSKYGCQTEGHSSRSWSLRCYCFEGVAREQGHRRGDPATGAEADEGVELSTEYDGP